MDEGIFLMVAWRMTAYDRGQVYVITDLTARVKGSAPLTRFRFPCPVHFISASNSALMG